jgi:soluble lytic murein transglycosylase-like protein
MPKRSIVAVLAFVSLIWATAAIADVYGYVDPEGMLHLATEKLDDRYKLFLRARDDQLGTSVAPDRKTRAEIDPTLMKKRIFQILLDHPNIAKYEPMIRAASKKYGLDPELVKAVVAVESGFQADAVSDKGAIGLMQLLPKTGERYGVRADRKKTVEMKLHDPKLNLDIGTHYLSDLLVMFPDRLDLALASYNAGENAVIRFRNTIPPFQETQAYVKLVDQFHAFYTPIVPTAKAGDIRNRIQVTLPARRNLPDPAAPPLLPAPPDSSPGVVDELAHRP